jgi:hypothetical protein
VELLPEDVSPAGPWSPTTSTTVAPVASGRPANDKPGSWTSPSVSPSSRELPNPSVPLSSTTWPAAYRSDGAAAPGLTTIHQTVTACPARSPLACKETAMPRLLRTNPELPTSTDSAGSVTTAFTGLVLTGLVVRPPRHG